MTPAARRRVHELVDELLDVVAAGDVEPRADSLPPPAEKPRISELDRARVRSQVAKGLRRQGRTV
jgi:hypothetical protein